MKKEGDSPKEGGKKDALPNKEQQQQEQQEEPVASAPTPSKDKLDSTSDSIRDNIRALCVATKMIEQINENLELEAAKMSDQEMSALTQKVSQAVQAANAKAQATGSLVRDLRAELEKQPSGLRTKRETECKTVTKAFTDELLMYQSAQHDFKNELKASLQRKLANVKSDANEDFVDVSIRSESRRSQLYRDITSGDLDLGDKMSDESAKAFKDDIREMYNAIHEFSQGSSKLNKVFLDLASTTVVESSDEEIDEEILRPKPPPPPPPLPPTEKKPKRGFFSFLRRGRKSPSPERMRTSNTAGNTKTKTKKRAWFRRPRRKRSRVAAMLIMATVALAAVMGVHMVLLQ